MQKNNISSLFIVNEDRRLAGVISAEECALLVERGSKDLTDVICTDIKTVLPDTPAQDLFNIIQDINYPLAVVDEANHLKGVIVRGSLIGALAERGDSQT
eukprot:TRINITY_DN96813_c0_g1_i1.p2 TRINITY_DN96813_c0_g1~~TRINITY_DN96813_c0_g1_i1.p2  ORF type:complete len:100 (+),score=25.38 TRINITY_DN96813_c0_g1_i1:1-300(+)